MNVKDRQPTGEIKSLYSPQVASPSSASKIMKSAPDAELDPPLATLELVEAPDVPPGSDGPCEAGAAGGFRVRGEAVADSRPPTRTGERWAAGPKP
jgi:hypothetical protein